MAEPFKIRIPEDQLEDLDRRLRHTRFPRQLDPAGHASGISADLMAEVVDHWVDAFDWRREESRLNEMPQFTEQIDGINLHFAHIRSPHEGALPLVMTHGWPGSFAEFCRIAPLLTHPEDHGGKAEDAFHLVCPSIPGYTFSSPPVAEGFNTMEAAKVQVELMRRLGYERYGVQGGDWGSVISANIARHVPEQVAGLHMNMPVAFPPPDMDDPMSVVTEEEGAGLAALQHWQTEGGGYFRIQSTRPDTLGFGLTDSPTGLAAWILEKFHAWSDGEDITETFGLDELLTNICLYWFTGSITSAARLYYEQEHHPVAPTKIRVPTAAAIFPKEIFCPPKAWVEALYNLQRWTKMEAGGHFAAMEQPQALAEDVRAFFAGLR